MARKSNVPKNGCAPAKSNTWIQPIEKEYLMQCCDCGLIHSMDFRVKNGRAQFRAFRITKASYPKTKDV